MLKKINLSDHPYRKPLMTVPPVIPKIINIIGNISILNLILYTHLKTTIPIQRLFFNHNPID